MSKMMREFLEQYLMWASCGAPDHGVFIKDFGLCTNAARFGGSRGMTSFESTVNRRELREELNLLLTADGLHPRYPFGGTEYRFAGERGYAHHHEHEPRIKWIVKKLKEV